MTHLEVVTSTVLDLDGFLHMRLSYPSRPWSFPVQVQTCCIPHPLPLVFHLLQQQACARWRCSTREDDQREERDQLPPTRTDPLRTLHSWLLACHTGSSHTNRIHTFALRASEIFLFLALLFALFSICIFRGFGKAGHGLYGVDPFSYRFSHCFDH